MTNNVPLKTNRSTSESGIFTPRILCALALCSLGVLLARFSLAAGTVIETRPAHTDVPPISPKFPNVFGGNANYLPPDVPLPPRAGLYGLAERSLQPRPAGGADSVRNHTVPSDQEPAASTSMPFASTESGWSIVNSPSGSAPLNYLSGVTCVSATDCWAVGYYHNGSADLTLIEHWDGTSWTVVASPNASRTQDQLKGVTCVSASECWAVGHSFNNNSGAYDTLTVRWDGTSWALVSSPNNASQFNFLLGVTCVSASDCWAVGDYYKYDSATGRNIPQTLIEHWDGTSWAIISSPNTSTSNYNFLSSVSCASASNCFAVGIQFTDLGIQTLIERWNGTSWAIVNSPNTDASDDNYLSAITCVSASDCWAVGTSTRIESGYRTLIQRWNGISWSIVSSPNVSGAQHNLLSGVTCASANDCWAVGHKSGATRTFDPLIEHWNGTSWAIVNSPDSTSLQADRLSSVACAAANDCWAVGYSNNSDFGAPTLVQRWDGTSWSIVNSPNGVANPPVDTFLSNVTCVSASDCWAVGAYFNGSAYQTLIERWDGTSWVIVASPNRGATQNNVLAAVTCVSASDCWPSATPRSASLVRPWSNGGTETRGRLSPHPTLSLRCTTTFPT